VPIDWTRVAFTEHMTEAAALVGECQVVLDFTPTERVQYEVKVYESLKGADGDDRYFAVGTRPDDPQGFRPVAGGTTPEAALQACLNAAGVHHRRRVKQADG
jgi:hypothetical protein